MDDKNHQWPTEAELDDGIDIEDDWLVEWSYLAERPARPEALLTNIEDDPRDINAR